MAESVVFVLDPLGYNKAFKTWGGTLGTWMGTRLEASAVTARVRAPGPGAPPRNTTGIAYGKGATKASITTRRHHATGGDLEGHLIAGTKQALWVHEGTRPHIILPRKPGGWLRFRSKGKVVYARMVKHPGVRIKQPFLWEGVKAAFPV